MINDVIDKYSYTIITRDEQIISDLTEKDIETLIPDLNCPVLILRGSYKGETATLIERDRKRNRVKVQLMNSGCEMLEYTQDDVCEFRAM